MSVQTLSSIFGTHETDESVVFCGNGLLSDDLTTRISHMVQTVLSPEVTDSSGDIDLTFGTILFSRRMWRLFNSSGKSFQGGMDVKEFVQIFKDLDLEVKAVLQRLQDNLGHEYIAQVDRHATIRTSYASSNNDWHVDEAKAASMRTIIVGISKPFKSTEFASPSVSPNACKELNKSSEATRYVTCSDAGNPFTYFSNPCHRAPRNSEETLPRTIVMVTFDWERVNGNPYEEPVHMPDAEDEFRALRLTFPS